MKRGILILLAAAALGLMTAAAFYFVGIRTSPTDWLRREFGLSGEQARQAAAMHAEFQGRCMEMCARIEAADERLQRLTQSTQSNRSMTPEIQAAIAESDQVRTECRMNMLEHFSAMAAIIPADQRERYMKKVLPLVQNPEQMAASR